MLIGSRDINLSLFAVRISHTRPAYSIAQAMAVDFILYMYLSVDGAEYGVMA